MFFVIYILISLVTYFELVSMQQQTMGTTHITQVASDPNKPGSLIKEKAFAQYRKEIVQAQQENKKIPKKDDSIFRIMTYNVHFWRNPENTQGAMQKMMEVIFKVNPDILILQEVSPNEGFAQGKYFTNSTAMNLLKSLGFTEFSACNTVPQGWFGNVIAGKKKFLDIKRFAFKGQKEGQAEARCYTVAQAMLPTNDNVYIYGTHLEVRDDGTIRLAQIQEIMARINQYLPNSNVLVAADFNATRKSGAVQQLQAAGYKDCFTYMGWQHPTFTTWAGTEIDFIFLSPKWHLPLAGCYVYYDAASDHLPVIMDINLAPEAPKMPVLPEIKPEMKPAYINTELLEEWLQTVQRDFTLINFFL